MTTGPSERQLINQARAVGSFVPDTPTPFTGPKQASDNPNTARISAQNISMMAKRLGRCGDINRLTGYVCVTQPHEDDVEHMAVQIGGPNDGHVYSTWGGRRGDG